MATMVNRVVEARRNLEDAINERETARARFDAAIGTSVEMSAYQRLRRAARRVTEADRSLTHAVAEDRSA